MFRVLQWQQKPASHNGSAPVLNTGPFGHPSSILGAGVSQTPEENFASAEVLQMGAAEQRLSTWA